MGLIAFISQGHDEPVNALHAYGVGWNKNTTYTVIKKCIDKGAIERREPNFQCFPLIRREEAQAAAVAELIEKVFGGSASLLFASLLSGKQLPLEEIRHLRTMIDELE